MPVNKEDKEKLLKLVKDAIKQDESLREQFQIGDKFRFIRDRLHALLTRVEENFVTAEEESVFTGLLLISSFKILLHPGSKAKLTTGQAFCQLLHCD